MGNWGYNPYQWELFSAPTFFVVKFATLLESQGTSLMGDFIPLALFGGVLPGRLGHAFCL